jgi:hypothetical protein
MNGYSLTAESHRWWWPSAAAGVAASSAIAVIALVPVTTHAASSEPREQGPAVSAPAADGVDDPKYRPCFMLRPNWNHALDGPPPRCVMSRRDAVNGQAKGTAAETRGPRRLAVGV